ncbi:LacI family DNA-binding transcriptional regulator [Mollicutes bacterium LVI A0078]|nr:LacI family DNA-binding transcriptional regulator [Mollicutes bacterium LVI A0075]WOO90155.1 LacI family DNA-binding transcriptional regulator [Mollicutes bacterium LVI A0078]
MLGAKIQFRHEFVDWNFFIFYEICIKILLLRSRMKSIREIAKLSGVSTATVSRYVNNTGTVSAEKAKSIQAVIDKYGYVPNEHVKAIFTGKTKDIGLIVQNVTNPFFSELVDGIMKVSTKAGHTIIVCNAMGDEQKELEYYQSMQQKRVSGLIVVNTCNPAIYKTNTIPLTSVDRRIENSNFIKVENELGISQFLNTYNARKFKKPLFIEATNYNQSSIERKKGAETYFALANINIDEVKVDDENTQVSEAVIDNLIDNDLIICWNDLVAHKVIAGLTKRGMNIPKDISVIGYDNIQINNFFAYELSTVDQAISQIAKEAVQTLLETITTSNIKDIVIKPKLIAGTTYNHKA